MKICIVGPGLKMGGIEGASCTMANALSRRGIKTTYLALFDFEPFFKLDNLVTYLKPNFINLPRMNYLRTALWIRHEIKTLNPDAIIVYSKFYSAFANIALLFTKYKIIISERSSPYYPWPLHIRLFSKVSFFLSKPKGIIAQTSIAQKVQGDKYGSNVPSIVVPNIIRDIELHTTESRSNTILALGRFNDPCKGFDLLIQAFAKMRNQDWKLQFAGGDADESNLAAMASILNISHRVEFLGKIKNVDLLLARTGIFVMPSRSEGFPNALIEAMGAGAPCISFDFVAGPRDIISHNVDGIIVEAENTSLLAEAFDDLIGDEAKRESLGKKAIEIRSRLSGENITSNVLSFISSIR